MSRPLEASHLRTPQALHRLAFVLALATLFLVRQGVALVQAGRRRLVGPHWPRGYSDLHIGWHYLRQALAHGGSLGTYLVRPSTPDRVPPGAAVTIL